MGLLPNSVLGAFISPWPTGDALNAVLCRQGCLLLPGQDATACLADYAVLLGCRWESQHSNLGRKFQLLIQSREGLCIAAGELPTYWHYWIYGVAVYFYRSRHMKLPEVLDKLRGEHAIKAISGNTRWHCSALRSSNQGGACEDSRAIVAGAV
jgi:hypothetical protein